MQNDLWLKFALWVGHPMALPKEVTQICTPRPIVTPKMLDPE